MSATESPPAPTSPSSTARDGTVPSSAPEGQSPKYARPKMFGRAFYESLGSPKLILAPMVDQSEFAWRLLTRSFLPQEKSKDLLAYTPMLHSRLFAETARYRANCFQPTKFPMVSPANLSAEEAAATPYLDGNPACDRPLIVQFCSNKPDELLEAARYVEPYCDAVDLNLGCPQGIARKGHYGAFLQEDLDLISRLINRLHTELSVPVTAKIRILESKEKSLAYAKTVLAAGASILTVHGRQRDQKGHNTGLADWSTIRYLRENLPADTVLFANGNILRHEDIRKCLEATGADGVMSAEGNLHDPTIFAEPPSQPLEGGEYWYGTDGKNGYRLDAVMRRYLDIIYKYVLQELPPERRPVYTSSDSQKDDDRWDASAETLAQPPSKKQKRAKTERPNSPSLLAMQAHLFRLLRPLLSIHTNVRDALARCRPGDMPAFEKVLSLVEEATRQGIMEYGAATNIVPEKHPEPDLGSKHESETTDHVGSEGDDTPSIVEICRKPWWVCQPYVRPLPQQAFEKGSMTLSKKQRSNLEKERNVVPHPLPRVDAPKVTRLAAETETQQEQEPEQVDVNVRNTGLCVVRPL